MRPKSHSLPGEKPRLNPAYMRAVCRDVSQRRMRLACIISGRFWYGSGDADMRDMVDLAAEKLSNDGWGYPLSHIRHGIAARLLARLRQTQVKS